MVSPKFCKSCPVPFSLRSEVEQTLKQQVDDGELLPVEQSDWATPIVVVTRKDEKLRICADFKVTINPQGNHQPTFEATNIPATNSR